ncbi:MAG TPA: endolytic transglycosylase MltG [Candidatus Moranbacteria bacterium]|nr:endolytic transglycosylase MltG [Candidatus Moranbacteria bacterium]
MNIKTKVLLVGLLVFLWVAFFVWWKTEREAFNSVASNSNIIVDFEAREGDGSTEVGEELQKAGLIKHRWYFYYYVWKTKTDSKLQAGTYELSPNMKIEEIVNKMTRGEVKLKTVKLVVPEGFNNQKIIKLLKEKKPELAERFQELAMCQCLNQPDCECDSFSQKFDFIKQLPKGVNLEGYLFPDTYFIEESDTAESLMAKFLTNFERKINQDLLSLIKKQKKDLHEVLTMASIVEREANNEIDRKLVAGILWRRIQEDMPLQVDATLSYILGEDRVKYYNKDIKADSLYNTYTHKGLPPGPIANPGMEAILDTLNPEKSDYLFFLSDAQTGEMVYAATIQEQEQNKKKHGL